MPTLVVVGEHDPVIEGVDAMRGLMNNLEIIVIEGANHSSAPTGMSESATIIATISLLGGQLQESCPLKTLILYQVQD